MPRSLFQPTSDPYHISSRCINREWFASPMSEVWEIFTNHLFLTQKLFNLRIHSFVLMSNHYHLLITAPELNISEAMNYLLREVSRQLLKDNQRINRTFSSRFFRSQVIGYHHFTTVYKYIYRNPVEAGLCNYVEEYPWSTLNGLLGLSKLHIPLEEDTLLFDSGLTPILEWLNKAPLPENRIAVQKAIRRSCFTLPKHNKYQHPLNENKY